MYLAAGLLREGEAQAMASLLGLQGSIVTSHCNATVEGFVYAIQQAMREVENKVPQLIAENVAAII